MTWALFRASLRLILRSFWLYAVTAPMLAIAWIWAAKFPGSSCVTEFFHQPALMPFFLGQMIATVAHVQTGQAQRVDETLEGTPYRSNALVLGRAGAVYTAWLGAGTLIFLLMVVRGVLPHNQPIDPILWWDWFLVIPLTLVFTTGVAYALGSLMRRGFAVYLVLLLLFLAGSFPFNQFFAEMYMGNLGAGPFTVTDFLLSSSFRLDRLPIFPDFWPLVFNRVHAIGAGLLCLFGVIWLKGRRRKESGTRTAAIVCLISLGLILAAFTASRSIWADRVLLMRAERAAVTAYDAQVTPEALLPAVDAYGLKVSVDPDGHGLKVEAAVAVTRAGEQALFTLGRSFDVAHVMGPDGRPVPFVRSGDLLLLTTAGRTGIYTVTYGGMVWQWRPDYWRGMRVAAHVAPESIMLPVGLGWYPLPGRQTLTYKGTWGRLADARPWHPPASFRLDVTGAGKLSLASNAMAGAPVTSAWLVGTPWEPVRSGRFQLFISPEHFAPGRQFAWEMGRELDWLDRWVPLGQSAILAEVPSSVAAVEFIGYTPGFPGGVIVAPGFLARMDGMLMQSHLSALWWNTASTEEEGQIHDVLRYFMVETYQREVNHRERAYVLLMRPGGQDGTKTEQGQQLLDELRTLHHTGGAEATGRVLQSLHRSPGPLTYLQVAGALRGEKP